MILLVRHSNITNYCINGRPKGVMCLPYGDVSGSGEPIFFDQGLKALRIYQLPPSRLGAGGGGGIHALHAVSEIIEHAPTARRSFPPTGMVTNGQSFSSFMPKVAHEVFSYPTDSKPRLIRLRACHLHLTRFEPVEGGPPSDGSARSLTSCNSNARYLLQ